MRAVLVALVVCGVAASATGSYCAELNEATCKLPLGCRWTAATRRCISPVDTVAPGPPDPAVPSVPLPWTTTQQRTHTFTNAEFLSIAEEQSMRKSTDGFDQQGFSIFPATPFSIRNAQDTIVKGMRAVFTTSPSSPGWVHEVIFLTPLEGPEYCFANYARTMKVTSVAPASPYKATIRGNGVWGAPVEGFLTTYGDGAGTLLTDYVAERRGGQYANGTGAWVKYPLRTVRDYNVTVGEHGFLLDQGQHFPVVIDRWFNLSDMTSCPSPPRVLSEPAMERAHTGVLADHHRHFAAYQDALARAHGRR